MTLASWLFTRSRVSRRSRATELIMGRPIRPSYSASPASMISGFEESILRGTEETSCAVLTSHAMARFWTSSR